MTTSSRPPMLSIIVPVWNGARYLAEAITSVLEQGLDDIELIVIDDGSEDESAEVVATFMTTAETVSGAPKVRFYSQPHMGLAAARNFGVSVACSPLLLHLDHDDVLTPGSLTTRLDVLSTHPDLDIVTGMMSMFVSPEIPAEQAVRYDLPNRPQQGGLPGASIIRARLVEKVGPFDTRLPQASDLDWMIRAREAGARSLVIPDLVFRRRVHGRNMSLLSNASEGRLQMLRAALKRRALSEDGSHR